MRLDLADLAETARSCRTSSPRVGASAGLQHAATVGGTALQRARSRRAHVDASDSRSEGFALERHGRVASAFTYGVLCATALQLGWRLTSIQPGCVLRNRLREETEWHLLSPDTSCGQISGFPGPTRAIRDWRASMPLRISLRPIRGGAPDRGLLPLAARLTPPHLQAACDGAEPLLGQG